MKNDKLSLKEYIKNNRALIIIIVLVMLLSYGYAITIADDLSIDEDLTVNHEIKNQTSVWYGFARFGIPMVYKVFFPEFAALPFFNMLLSVMLIGCAALALCYFIYKFISPAKAPKSAYYFLAVMMVTYPSSVDYLTYNNLNFSIALGILLTCISAYFVSKWVLNKDSILFGVFGLIICAFTISIYQSFVGVFLTCATAFSLAFTYKSSFIDRTIRFKEIMIYVLKYIAVLALAIGLYYALNWLILEILSKKSNGYTESLAAMGSVKQLIYNLYYNFKLVIIKGGVRGGENILYIVLAFLTAQVALLFKKGLKNKILIISLSLVLVLSPFALAIIFPGIMIRALTGLALMVGLCVFFMLLSMSHLLKKTNERKIDYRRIIFTILAVLLIFTSYIQIYRTNLYYYGTHIRYQRDEAFAHMLASDVIDELDDISFDVPVIFLGEYEIAVADNIDKTAFEGSFFSYDQVPFRIGLFMNYLGYKFELPDHALVDKTKHYADDMPIWPKKGSIKEFDECIIVKISDDY